MSKEQLTELIALTKAYITQEHAPTSWTSTDPSTFAYYKQYAIDQKSSKPTPSPKPTSPLPPTSPAPIPTRAYVPPPPPKTPVTPIAKKPSPPAKPPAPEKKPPKSDIDLKNIAAFQLEPPTKHPPVELQSIRQILQEKFPGHLHIEEIPSDAKAHEINNRWKQELIIPPILLLAFNEPPQHLRFLQNVAHAITSYGIQAQVISADKLEMHKGWDIVLKSADLKHIIASTHSIQTHPILGKQYSEKTKDAQFFINSVPFYPLADISTYLKNPNLKATLWQELKKIILS